jgi:hypothetical protein
MAHLGGAAGALAGRLPPGLARGRCWSLQTGAGGALRRLYRHSKGMRVALLVVVMLGTAMVIGDGVLTPSISGAARRGGWRRSGARGAGAVRPPGPQPGPKAAAAEEAGPARGLNNGRGGRPEGPARGTASYRAAAARRLPFPAVLSAIGGLQVATSAISTPAILGITIAVLCLLFAVQRLGTGKARSRAAARPRR